MPTRPRRGALRGSFAPDTRRARWRRRATSTTRTSRSRSTCVRLRNEPPMSNLLAGYQALPDRYDELLDAQGAPRPQWQAFLASLGSRDMPQIGDTLSLVEREIRENGVTYNVYADEKGAD